MARKKTMGGVAEIKREGRDYVFDACALIQRCCMLKDANKEIEKSIKTTKETLEEKISRGVTEGPRSGMLFPSMETAKLQAEAVTLQHIEMGLVLARRLQDVPLDDLEMVRGQINGVLDGVVRAKPTGEAEIPPPAAEAEEAPDPERCDKDDCEKWKKCHKQPLETAKCLMHPVVAELPEQHPQAEAAGQ